MKNLAASAPASERDEARARRVQEAQWLDEARILAQQRRTVSEAQVDAWIDSLGEEVELPPPATDV